MKLPIIPILTFHGADVNEEEILLVLNKVKAKKNKKFAATLKCFALI